MFYTKIRSLAVALLYPSGIGGPKGTHRVSLNSHIMPSEKGNHAYMRHTVVLERMRFLFLLNVHFFIIILRKFKLRINKKKDSDLR